MRRISAIACATLGVRDVRATSTFYRDVFDYLALASGVVDPSLAALWQLRDQRLGFMFRGAGSASREQTHACGRTMLLHNGANGPWRQPQAPSAARLLPLLQFVVPRTVESWGHRNVGYRG